MYQKIVLGTAQFGRKYGISNSTGKISLPEIFKILEFLKKKKIKFLDTARSYAKSESEIGSYFKKRNQKFKIITKFSFKSPDSISRQFENSFYSLGYLPDTILAHSSKDYLNPIFHKEIELIKKKYYIKNIGVSLYDVKELKKILKYKKPDIIQVPVNILDRSFLDEKIIKLLKKKSIKILGRSIFLQGLFFKKEEYIYKNFKNIKTVYKKLLEIASAEKMSLSGLSLNWAYNLKEIDKIIIGIDSLSHLKKNLKIIERKISKNGYKKIKEINIKNNMITKPNLWKIK